MLLLTIVLSKKDDDSVMRPSKAFLSKTRAMAYINAQKEIEPTTTFDTAVVNFEDIESMKVWLVTDHECCCNGADELHPDMIFYDKRLADSAPKLMEFPLNKTDVIEYTLRGNEFMDEYMREKGVNLYIKYQVLFTADGEIDTSDPTSNTVEEYFTDDELELNTAIIDNDDPYGVHVVIYYSLGNPLGKERLVAMAKEAREEYIHNKFNLGY